MATLISRIIFQKLHSLVCVVHLLPPCLYPLEVLAAGIQQFMGNRSSSKDMPLSLLSPQLGVDQVACGGRLTSGTRDREGSW